MNYADHKAYFEKNIFIFHNTFTIRNLIQKHKKNHEFTPLNFQAFDIVLKAYPVIFP